MKGNKDSCASVTWYFTVLNAMYVVCPHATSSWAFGGVVGSVVRVFAGLRNTGSGRFGGVWVRVVAGGKRAGVREEGASWTMCGQRNTRRRTTAIITRKEVLW
jgi:hypothetical protein